MKTHEKDGSTMSKQRIESFSDGVFAIVVTLLIFSFQLPTLTGPAANANHELLEKLLALTPRFVSYILSFTLISMFWIAHHKLFHNLKRSDAGLLWINNIFLMALAFMPFPTQVLGAYYNLENAVIFFGSAMVVASACFAGLQYYAFFKGKLVDADIPQKILKSAMKKSLLGIAIYIVALVVSFVSDNITLRLEALIPFLYFVPVQFRR